MSATLHDFFKERKSVVKKQKRKEWLCENWVSFFGLVFAAIAAVAAIIAAVVSIVDLFI